MKFPIRIVSRTRYEKMKYANEALALYNRLRDLQKNEQTSGGILNAGILKSLRQGGDFGVLDIGANSGDWSKTLLRLFPNAISYALEADPETFKTLCNNTSAQGRIHPFNALLSSDRREMTFYSSDISVISSVHKHATTIGHARPIRLISSTLDDIVAKHGIQSIKLLKVDTEGRDLEVLKGAQRLIQSPGLEFIIVEFGIDPENKTHIHLNTFVDFLTPKKFYVCAVADWGVGYEPIQFGNALFVRMSC